LLCGDPGRVSRIARRLENARTVSEVRGFIVVTGELDGVAVTVASTGIGGPSTAMLVEALIDMGAGTLIRVGTSGSLQSHVGLGDIVIAAAAVRDDGTTKTYVPAEYPAVASYEVVAALAEAARQLGYRHHTGVVHSKDAFFIETPERLPARLWAEERLRTWIRAGVLATEMECSTLFTLASIRGVRSGAVLAVVGDTAGGRPIVDESAGVKEAIDVAVKAVRALAEVG